MLRAIDHVQIAIPVGGEDQARPFYGALLGLTEVPKPVELAGRGGCWFEGAVKVHLGVEQDFRANVKAHVAFVVDDVAGLAERAATAGYETKANDEIADVERIFIFDPFGNRLEFLAPLPKFGLTSEQYRYAQDLAVHAGWGAWVNPVASDLPHRSALLLSGQIESDADERTLLTDLLYLAAYSADHSWEAPTLTGYSTDFAVATYEKITQFNA